MPVVALCEQVLIAVDRARMLRTDLHQAARAGPLASLSRHEVGVRFFGYLLMCDVKGR